MSAIDPYLREINREAYRARTGQPTPREPLAPVVLQRIERLIQMAAAALDPAPVRRNTAASREMEHEAAIARRWASEMDRVGRKGA